MGLVDPNKIVLQQSRWGMTNIFERSLDGPYPAFIILDCVWRMNALALLNSPNAEQVNNDNGTFTRSILISDPSLLPLRVLTLNNQLQWWNQENKQDL